MIIKKKIKKIRKTIHKEKHGVSFGNEDDGNDSDDNKVHGFDDNNQDDKENLEGKNYLPSHPERELDDYYDCNDHIFDDSENSDNDVDDDEDEENSNTMRTVIMDSKIIQTIITNNSNIVNSAF